MSGSVLGWVHLAFSVAALATGLVVVARPKGTGPHRRAGLFYVGSMLGLNATALMIYQLFGRFGPFHVAALLSLATVSLGFIPARRRRPRGTWVEQHAYWMSWSYVGLLAAAASEATTRIPESSFLWMVVIATAVVIGSGALIINRRVPGILKVVGRPSAR